MTMFHFFVRRDVACNVLSESIAVYKDVAGNVSTMAFNVAAKNHIELLILIFSTLCFYKKFRAVAL